MYIANKNKTYTAYLFVYVTEHSLMFRVRFYITDAQVKKLPF